MERLVGDKVGMAQSPWNLPGKQHSCPQQSRAGKILSVHCPEVSNERSLCYEETGLRRWAMRVLVLKEVRLAVVTDAVCSGLDLKSLIS